MAKRTPAKQPAPPPAAPVPAAASSSGADDGAEAVFPPSTEKVPEDEEYLQRRAEAFEKRHGKQSGQRAGRRQVSGTAKALRP